FKDCKRLTVLRLSNTKVSDAGLAHFKDCKGLIELHLDGTQVGDAGLARLKGFKNLSVIHLRGTRVSDLSPLRGLPLREITCDVGPELDALRSTKTLDTINGKPAGKFWEEYAGERVRAFAARLQKLNPDFDGKVAHDAEGGAV